MAMASLSPVPSISTLPPAQSPLLLRAGGALRLRSRISSTPSAVPSLRFRPAHCPALSVRASAMDVASGGDSGADNEVTLLDYGAGNVRSIRNAIHLLGFKIREVNEPEDIGKAKRLIFPGVGAIKSAMGVLEAKGLAEPLVSYIKQDRPFLGICLGLQLLFERSEEGDCGFKYPIASRCRTNLRGNFDVGQCVGCRADGLGIIPGVVGRFDSSNGLCVPHIGWNGLQLEQDSASLLEGVKGRHVYFVHSYRATPSEDNKDWVLATTKYGSDFISAIRKSNVYGVQFHPEKSGVAGLDIVRRFLGGSHSEAAQDVERLANECVRKPATALAKRVIACLDVRSNDTGDLVVTKGDQYDVREQSSAREVRNLGKPVELAGRYFKEGADEVTFLNITGFRDFPLGDMPMLEVLQRTSEQVFVPLTVGGGISDFTDAHGRFYSCLEVASEYFRSGADKISIGSDAVYAAEEYIRSGVKTGKSSLEQISYVYGNQAVVVSIDPKRVYVNDPSDVPYKTVEAQQPGPNGEKFAWYQCTVKGGREMRPIGVYELAKAVQDLGAGEILLNCIDCDGQGQGFDIDLVNLVSDAVTIPVIASSGAGSSEHFSEVFHQTRASAALAAGIFHRKEVEISSVKKHLISAGVETRLL